MLTPTCLASSELQWQTSRFNWRMFPEWLNWWCDLGSSLCLTHLVLRIKILGVLGGDLRSTQGSSGARTRRFFFNAKWLIIKSKNLLIWAETTWNQFCYRPFCYFEGGTDSKMFLINTKSAKQINVTRFPVQGKSVTTDFFIKKKKARYWTCSSLHLLRVCDECCFNLSWEVWRLHTLFNRTIDCTASPVVNRWPSGLSPECGWTGNCWHFVHTCPGSELEPSWTVFAWVAAIPI